MEPEIEGAIPYVRNKVNLLQLYGLNIDEVPAEYFQNYLIDLFFEYSAMNRTLYFSDNFVTFALAMQNCSLRN